ncbi:MAG: hypothetical protein ABH967_01235 [Patescibacteria group bacterium]
MEIIPRQIKKSSANQDILFYVSISLLVVIILSQLILGFLVNKSENILEELEITLAEKKTGEEKDKEDLVFNTQKKIRDFPIIISRHIYPSKVFRFFEELCHPDVWFSGVKASLSDNSINIFGNASNFSVLDQQLIIFQEDPLIIETHLSDLNINKKGGVSFNFNLAFDSQAIK